MGTLELIALRLGVPTEDALGRRTLGEHVWRVSGSRHLAALDIPIAIIMKLARWESGVVHRYLADAPLSALTRIYLERAAASAAAIQAVLALPALPVLALGAGPAAAVADVGQVSDLVSFARPGSAELADPLCNDGFAFIQHTGTLRVHYLPVEGEVDFASPNDLVTLCKWAYGLDVVRHLDVLPPSPRMCRDCVKAAARLTSAAASLVPAACV